MIARDTIDKIFDAARIEEVVGEFVQLKKAGSNYKGLSPWGNEKTPSFFVSPAKGIFKDFSSGKGGNAVSFLMELESMTYPEALRYLANKYQIVIEETEMDPAQKQEVGLRESLALINSFANEYFIKALWESEEGKSIGLSYFRERGFNDQTIKKFELGYSFDENDAFLKAAKEAGYNADLLIKLGLTKEGDYGKYDFFRGRVIFPIRNVSGRYIAFAGRTLRSDNKVKYLNSPESELYDKSSSLYGIFEAKRSIIKEDLCFLVEGYTDVISLHQAGVEYAVSSSGTSLTPSQIKLIKRYTNNVSLLFDGDPAGIKAALRGIDLLLEEGMNVKVVLFPEGHDPDSFARSVSGTELERYLKEEPKDFTDFMLDVMLADGGNDPIKKAEATRRLVQSLSHITDHIARSIYIERCSKKLEIPEQALYNELNKLLRKKQLARAGVDPEIITKVENEKVRHQKEAEVVNSTIFEKEIARILLTYGNQQIIVEIKNEEDVAEELEVIVAEYILHDLSTDDIRFDSPLYKRIIDEFHSFFEENEIFPDTNYFVNNPDPSFSEAIAGMIATPYELSENWEAQHKIYTVSEQGNLRKAVFDPLMHLKQSHVTQMREKLERAIKAAENEEEITLLLQEKIKLDGMKMEVGKYFGSTII
ncbi:DNA primase [Cryomorpha ignava]|uniref:DNA primase n=1 Tax=Cryomorpha ignava TaxID=101383 RepID=A0A7K3WVN8_9FLAO|nr:DNA primase [Cryomorpha ignava]NEN25769.1 DNA primase [Cryomorpha ignava]